MNILQNEYSIVNLTKSFRMLAKIAISQLGPAMIIKITHSKSQKSQKYKLNATLIRFEF